MAVDLKPYDYPQVLRSVFEVEDNCLRVKVINSAGSGGELEVLIDHTEDSIRLGDGTNFISSTSNGGKNGLDVNLINSSIPVTATDLDIRNLSFGTDKVDVSGSSVFITDAENSVNVYNEILSVASGVLTNIVSFTATQNSKLKQVSVSGENIATFEVLVNGNIVSKKRTYFGGTLNETFFFDKGIAFISGQQVLVRVLHNRPSTANFNANLLIVED